MLIDSLKSLMQAPHLETWEDQSPHFAELLRNSDRIKVAEHFDYQSPPESLSADQIKQIEKRKQDLGEHFGKAAFVVFVGGVYEPRYSKLTPLTENNGSINLYSYNDMTPEDQEVIDRILQERLEQKSMAVFNSVLVRHGMGHLIHVPRAQPVEAPLIILNVLIEGGTSFLPIFFRFSSGAKACVLEDTLILPSNEERQEEREREGNHLPQKCFSCTSMTITLGKGAQLIHQWSEPWRLYEDQVALYRRYDIKLAEEASYRHARLDLGSFFSRTEHAITLQGERSEALLGVAELLRRDGRSESWQKIQHLGEQSRSSYTHRLDVSGRSSAKVRSEAKVGRAVRFCKVQQSLKSLAEDQARVRLRPFLEILNDDVQASHGAATGSLPEEWYQYLMNRGLSKEEARQLFVTAHLQAAFQEVAPSQLIQAALQNTSQEH